MIVNVYLEFYPGIFQEIIDLLIPLNLKCLILVPGLVVIPVFPEYPYPDQVLPKFICAAEVRSA